MLCFSQNKVYLLFQSLMFITGLLSMFNLGNGHSMAQSLDVIGAVQAQLYFLFSSVNDVKEGHENSGSTTG
jgi:hypothetical protein